MLDGLLPGTEGVSYALVLESLATSCSSNFYLVGGRVADVLQGSTGQDHALIFAYAPCTARDVALACVKNEWPVKYTAQDSSLPNRVLIGSEENGNCTTGALELFGLSNSRQPGSGRGAQPLGDVAHAAFRTDLLVYCMTNDVILDKPGCGVEDLQTHALRLACDLESPSSLEAWALHDSTYGLKALRYVKCLLRAKLRGEAMTTDPGEEAHVVQVLRSALPQNVLALRATWFRQILGEELATGAGVRALYVWVVAAGGTWWWLADWEPLVHCATSAPLPPAASAAAPDQLRGMSADGKLGATPGPAPVAVHVHDSRGSRSLARLLFGRRRP